MSQDWGLEICLQQDQHEHLCLRIESNASDPPRLHESNMTAALERTCYLEQDVRGVMEQHDQGADAN